MADPPRSKIGIGIGKRPAIGARAKAALPKPKQKLVLSLDEATAQLAALDLANMTENERLSAILEARARLDEKAPRDEDPAKTIERRLLLLKIWNDLLRLRVANVQLDKEPTFEKAPIERMFVPIPSEPEIETAEVAPEPVPAPVQPAPRLKPLKPLTPKPIPAPEEVEPVAEDQLVSVKLLASETVRGIRLEAGMVVSVQPEDATSLVEKGKAIRVKDQS